MRLNAESSSRPLTPSPPLFEGGGGVAKRTKAVCSKLSALTSWGVLINGAAWRAHLLESIYLEEGGGGEIVIVVNFYTIYNYNYHTL